MSKAAPRIGGRLHAAARRVLDARAVLQVIEPTLADLQHELRGEKRFLRRLWIRWRGYAAFWQVLCLDLIWERSSMDRHVMLRLIAGTTLALACYVIVLRLLPAVLFFTPTLRSSWMPYLVVEGLASVMPFAVFAFVLWWARSGAFGEQRVKTALFIGVIAGLVATSIGMWAVPPSLRTVSTSPEFSWAARLGLATIQWVWASIAVTAFALLGFAIAPYSRRRILLCLLWVGVPLVFVIVQSVISVATAQLMVRSLTWVMLARFVPCLVVLGLSGWMLRPERVAV